MNNSRSNVFRKPVKACEFTHVSVFMRTRRADLHFAAYRILCRFPTDRKRRCIRPCGYAGYACALHRHIRNEYGRIIRSFRQCYIFLLSVHSVFLFTNHILFFKYIIQYGAWLCDTSLFSLMEAVEIAIIILWAASLFYSNW